MIDLDELERLHRMARPHKWEPIDRDGYSEEEINNSNLIAAIKNACDDGLLERLRTAEDVVAKFREEQFDLLAQLRCAESARAEIAGQAEAAEASLAALKAENERLREAGRDLLQHVDDQTCTHESVHRGGTIWTICDECGKEWADDKGGFQPHEDAPAVAAFRTALETTNG